MSRPIFYAVGGTDQTRKNRASFLYALHPDIISNALVPGDGDLTRLRIHNSIPDIHKGKSECEVRYDQLTIGANDYVLLIGHVDKNAFKQFMESLQTQPELWVMGPGFNYMDAPFVYPNGHWIRDSDCYRYSAQEWEEDVFQYYPPDLQTFHHIQVGAFWTTRSEAMVKERGPIMTSAFYNQFGLNYLPQQGTINIISFETSVAHALNRPDIEAELNQIDTNRSVEDVLKAVARVYKNKTFPDLADCGKTVLSMIGASEGIKEYDGLVAHTMLRRIGGSRFSAGETKGNDEPNYKPSREQHLQFMKACLSKNDSDYVRALRHHVQANLGDGVIHTFHDLGLDPQSDDWIAIRIIKHILDVPAGTSARFRGISGLVKDVVIESNMGANGLEGHYRVVSHIAPIQDALQRELGDHLTANQYNTVRSIFATQQKASVDMAKEVLDAHGVDMDMAHELIFHSKNWCRV